MCLCTVILLLIIVNLYHKDWKMDAMYQAARQGEYISIIQQLELNPGLINQKDNVSK